MDKCGHGKTMNEYCEACAKLSALDEKRTKELARYQAIATAARDARIALTFYREWMLTHGEGETKYPFGVDAERTLAAALAALEQETK